MATSDAAPLATAESDLEEMIDKARDTADQTPQIIQDAIDLREHVAETLDRALPYLSRDCDEDLI